MDLVAALDAKRNEMEAKHARERERERGCNHLGVLRLIARLSTEIVQNALDPIQKRRRRKRVRERERGREWKKEGKEWKESGASYRAGKGKAVCQGTSELAKKALGKPVTFQPARREKHPPVKERKTRENRALVSRPVIISILGRSFDQREKKKKEPPIGTRRVVNHSFVRRTTGIPSPPEFNPSLSSLSLSLSLCPYLSRLNYFVRE